jgi:hypothetical protein
MSQMKAPGRRIEAHIALQALADCCFSQPGVGHLADESSFLKNIHNRLGQNLLLYPQSIPRNAARTQRKIWKPSAISGEPSVKLESFGIVE